ncbi:MAG: sodium/proton antiporter, family, partial [Polaromonas sp.]|nr:sodium/proton antiporter, family [Polaromonas sp.]
LATVSMLVTVACVTALGVWGLGMSLGGAVLLGAILAPTDPVLASDVQVADTQDRDRLRFGLTGEGGMNDGTAFPLVVLGLGLLGLHALGDWGWRWWAVDVLWAIAGGLGLGAAMGALVGRLILYLRMRHREALGSDEFIALGLIALTYGLALYLHTYGFLAVFAAGLALQRVGEKPSAPAPFSAPAAAPGDGQLSDPDASASAGDSDDAEASIRQATGPEAPAQMMLAVQRFNTQLESFVEVGIVLAVGVLMASVEFRAEVLWFIPLLFLVIRPLSVGVGLIGTQVKGNQRGLIAWFGIRGIGSLYYLLYAINHGVEPELAQLLLSITVAVVVASVVLHGVSVTPLMSRYEARKKARVGARSE